MSRRHPKRKSGAGRFAMLPVRVLATQAVTTLNHAQFRILVLLAAQFDGRNNGALGLTRSQAANNGISSNNTLYGALRELEIRGLIEQTYPASRVPPRPSMYCLTWLPVNDTSWSQASRVPTHGYREWTAPPKFKRQRQKKPALKIVST